MMRLSSLIFLMILVAMPVSGKAGHQNHGELRKILQALQKNGPISLLDSENTEEYKWIEVALHDERYPLTIDLVKSQRVCPQKIAFMVAPSGYNFRFQYFTPRQKNVAAFFAQEGYLVVGISFREDMLPPEEAEEDVAEWGIEKHVNDMHKVISVISKRLKLPYLLFGQSSGGICILDYASKYSHKHFEKVVLLDTDSFDPQIQPEKVGYASLTHDAMVQLMDQGVLVDAFSADIKELIIGANLFPLADSGVPRPEGLPENFTLAGLLHFSLIYTSALPGLHSEITGLPGEWALVKGAADGFYNFDLDPSLDEFSFSHTSVPVLAEAAGEMGLGSAPLAFARDAYGLLALEGAYTINWEGIEEPVVMVNGELSSGNQTYYATLLEQAGNESVTITVVPGYAYVDLVFGAHADQDVWPYLLQ